MLRVQGSRFSVTGPGNIDFTIFLLFAYFSDTLIHTVISYQRQMKVKRMVLLVCAGRSGTEMQGTDLCVCLDTNIRALY